MKEVLPKRKRHNMIFMVLTAARFMPVTAPLEAPWRRRRGPETTSLSGIVEDAQGKGIKEVEIEVQANGQAVGTPGESGKCVYRQRRKLRRALPTTDQDPPRHPSANPA
jgi:hypothetical protein